MADKNMGSADFRGSESEDDELAALREAALRSKKSRLPNSRPSSDSEPLLVPSMPVLSIPVQPVPVLSLPPPIIPVQSLPVAPLVVCPPTSHFQRHPFKVQDKERFTRNGSQNFVRAPRSNLIVIQTVPLDEKQSTEPKRPEAASSQEKITLIRPQDKWAPTSDVKAASPAKPKVPTKFDRYEESESDTDEDMSGTDDSESEYIFSSEKHSVTIDEPEKGAGTPDADQFPRDSSPTTDTFNKQEDDCGSLKIESTDVDVNLADLNSASNEQLCEQSMLESNSRPEDVPCASFEEPPSQQHDSKSSHSSHSSEFQAKEKTDARSGSRTQLKSPVSSMSPVSSGSLSRSSSRFTPCFDEKDERLLSQASPARPSLRAAFLDQSTSLISSKSSFSSSPWSHRGRQSPALRRGSKGRSHSRDSSLRSNGRSASFGSPMSSRSRSRPRSPSSRPRSPMGLKSPRRLRSNSPSWSSTPLGSPLRNRSKTRSRSPPKTKKHSRSPVDHYTRTLVSPSPEHSSSRFRSKISSGLDEGKHLNSRSQKPVLPTGHGSAFHHSNSPTLVRSYESGKSPQRTSGHIRSKDSSRSPGYAMVEKMSPRLTAKAGTLISCRSSRRSGSPLKFRTVDSSWSLKQSRYSGRGSMYMRSKSPSPQKLTSGNSSPDFGRYKSSPMRLPRSQSPWKRFSGSRSRSPPSRSARSRSRLSRFSRSRSPPIRRSRSRSPSVPRSFSPGMPQEYKPSGISRSRNGDSSHSYRNDRRLRHSPTDVWRSDDVGATFDNNAFRNRFRNESHGYSDSKELLRHEHHFEKKTDGQLGSTKALDSQSGRRSDCLRYDTQENLGDKQRPKDVRPKEQASLLKLGRDAKQKIGDRQRPKHELLKGKNCERRENKNQENISINKTFADEKNLTRMDSARPGNDPSCVKADNKDFRPAKESDRTVSEKLSVRASVDSEIPLSRRRFSICDDSESESETVDHRQKHYIERKDLDTTRDSVLQKRNNKQLQNSRFTSDDKRQKGYNYNRFIREERGTRQDYIPPLMEGIQFRDAALRGQSPRRPAKRPRSRSPPVKSVLSMVKLAKTSDPTEVETKKSKPSSQLPVEKHKTSSRLQKRNYVSDEIKDSPDVLTVGCAKGSSHGRPKVRAAEQTAHDKVSQSETVGDQRMIQITFNQKMKFDGVNSTRPSVHERLGTFDVATAGKEKKVVDKSGSSLAVTEEKKFADLRDLIGDKLRNVAYDLDGDDGNNSGKGDGSNDLYMRRSAKTNHRRRKFNSSSAGNLEARQSGRAKY